MTATTETERTTVYGTVYGPHLIPQPHGGALKSGGTPGNKGGPGSSPDAIRAILRESFAKRIPLLEAIADGAECVDVVVRDKDGTETVKTMKARPDDRMRAIELLAKYGLGTADKVEITPRDALSQDERLSRIDALLTVLARRAGGGLREVAGALMAGEATPAA